MTCLTFCPAAKLRLKLKLKTAVANVDSACDEGSYAPHPSDCNQYLFCLWNKYQQFSCANGLHWNVVSTFLLSIGAHLKLVLNCRARLMSAIYLSICRPPQNQRTCDWPANAQCHSTGPSADVPVPTGLPTTQQPPTTLQPTWQPTTQSTTTRPTSLKPRPPPQADVIYDKPGSGKQTSGLSSDFF